MDLLESMQAQFTLSGGEQLRLAGFMAVNREKLKNLPEEKIAELFKTDELELVYLHLQSMTNFSAMAERNKAAATEESAKEFMPTEKEGLH